MQLNTVSIAYGSVKIFLLQQVGLYEIVYTGWLITPAFAVRATY